MRQQKIFGWASLLAIITSYFCGATIGNLIFVVIMAFFQNLAYGLQARARMRDNNTYHVIAIFVASFSFFYTLQYLSRNNLPLILLPTYIAATCYGTLWGNRVSMLIEKKIRAVVDLGQPIDKKIGFVDYLKVLMPSAIVLLGILASQLLLVRRYSIITIILVASLALLESFFFSVTTITRNANNYTIHYIATLIQNIIKFVSLKILISEKMSWYLLLPQTSGGALGSITGTASGKYVIAKHGESYNSHLYSDGIKIPFKEVIITSSFVIPQLLLFGIFDWRYVSLVLVASLAQAVAFSLISRARQRDSEQYTLLTSIFSNGVWYFTVYLLVAKELPAVAIIPYVAGSLIGGMFGQGIGMAIEKKFNIKLK